jgi:hypothetical protein
MPIQQGNSNNIEYYVLAGVEYRREYTADGFTAIDRVVDAVIMATPEYATYHAAEDAVPIAAVDVVLVADGPPEAALQSIDDGV